MHPRIPESDCSPSQMKLPALTLTVTFPDGLDDLLEFTVNGDSWQPVAPGKSVEVSTVPSKHREFSGFALVVRPAQFESAQ